MSIDLGTTIGVVGVFIAVFGYILNRDRDKKNNATSEAEVKVTLSHISHGINDIKVDARSQQEQIRNILIDVAEVKSSTNSAHKRIDNLEGRNNEN